MIKHALVIVACNYLRGVAERYDFIGNIFMHSRTHSDYRIAADFNKLAYSRINADITISADMRCSGDLAERRDKRSVF